MAQVLISLKVLPAAAGHVKWIQGFRVKIVIVFEFPLFSIPKRDLNIKKTAPNIEICPESLEAVTEY